MTTLPIILDNFVEDDIQNQIEDGMFDCSWRFFNDNVYGSRDDSVDLKYRKFINFMDFERKKSPILACNIFRERIFSKFKPIVEKSCKKINFSIESIERCYGGIHILNKDTKSTDNIHVNRSEPHLVMIYYVIDSDGETILYDKQIGDIPFEKSFYPENHYQFNIKNKIKPKKGRILFFDGRVYHSSSTPIKTNRCIITLDLFGKFLDGSYDFSNTNKKTNKLINY